MHHADLLEKLNNLTAKIGIAGMGYVGLPLMLRYNAVGYEVLGFDVDATKVVQLNEGKSYIEHIPSASVAKARQTGFQATTNMARARECDALILCVPTPLNAHREPDMSFVIDTVNSLCPHLRPGQVM